MTRTIINGKMKQVIFICASCQDRNKALLGTEGYEVKQTEFESMTEAYEHMINTNCHIEAVVKE